LPTAVGNVSTNTATANQTADLAAGAPALLVGPQTIGAAGGATNSSDGLGEVGTGKATATGNLSESELDQTAAIDGGGAVIAPITSTIANAGLGLANAGVNLGVGNASTNTATLTQTASGVGTVFNDGEASNSSDGTGQVGDPDCDDEKAPPTEQPPGAPTLPRTGGAIETIAAVGLMLLLLGFGATVTARRRVAAA
jgi:LPXTG-motif cell wall-anchored protein